MEEVDAGKPSKVSGRGPLIAVAVVVVVAVLAVAGVLVWQREGRRRALAECTDATSQYQDRKRSLDRTRAAAGKTVKETPAGDVSDAKLLQAAAKAVGGDGAKATAKPAKDGGRTIPSCPADADKATLETNAGIIRRAASTIARDAKLITDSQSALRADVARTVKSHLDTAVTDGDRLLADTDGKVADNAPRDALRTALDQGKAVQRDTKALVGEERKAVKAIDDQMKAVNDSKAAKDQADAAAQQAAAAQDSAGASTVQSGGSGYSNWSGNQGGGYSGWSGGGNQGGSGSGGSHQAPAAPAPAPAPAPPAGNSNSMNEFWQDVHGPGGPAINKDGVCVAGCH